MARSRRNCDPSGLAARLISQIQPGEEHDQLNVSKYKRLCSMLKTARNARKELAKAGKLAVIDGSLSRVNSSSSTLASTRS